MSSRTDTIVIGAGQAGLAASYCLTDAGRDHVVLERGRLAEAWWSERWDSLRLLSPSWMTRLPGLSYAGPDPDGYMSVPDVIDLFSGYARSFDAPVQEQTSVERVDAIDGGYRVTTDQGTWSASNVIVATGATGRPFVPAVADTLAAGVHQITANRYRNPSRLPDGGVLVVGASASGVQIAEELRRAGRDVLVAVGAHSRMPRRYRGMDILWWLDRLGVFDTSIDDMPDPVGARRAPSLQIAGRPGGNADLAVLLDAGVRLTGHVQSMDGHTVGFADDLESSVAASERRLQRWLTAIDEHVDAHGLSREVLDPEPVAPIRPAVSPGAVDLRADGISTIVWATGYRQHYPWLHVPVLDGRGEMIHRHGVTDAPGLYVLGLRFQSHRNSNFIDGVGRDARAVVDHLAARSLCAQAA